MEKYFHSALFALFTATIAKLLIVSTSWEGVVLSVILGAMYSVLKITDSKQMLAEVSAELKAQKQELTQLNKDLAEFRTFVATSKMSNQLRR